MEGIRNLYNRILKLSFPSPRGKEIAGIDLVLLDSDIMGLGDSFIGKKGILAIEKIKMLKECKNDLDTVLPLLEQFERQYFEMLDELLINMINISTRN